MLVLSSEMLNQQVFLLMVLFFLKLRGCTKGATGNLQLFAKERVLNQSLQNRSNLESDDKALTKIILADHRVFRSELDVDRCLTYFDRFSDKQPDRNIPFVSVRSSMVAFMSGLSPWPASPTFQK